MRIFIGILGLLLCCPFFSLAQAETNQENLEKYWAYRSRFLGKDGFGGFISIGAHQGQSIPASSRDIHRNCKTDWQLMNSKTPRHEGQGIMRWGDATVHLGYYLATLALEYQNLRQSNGDTRATVRELYYALKAYERIDTQAEVTLGLAPELNGFFLRDDIPVDFYKDSSLKDSLRFAHPTFGGYGCVGSDYCKGTRTLNNGSYISQDQVTALLFGLAFVKKFAGTVSYPEATDELFGDLAMQYSHLMVSYMQSCKWRLKSPNGIKIPGRWGGDARGFSILFAKAADNITEATFDHNYNKRTFLSRMAKGSFGWAFGLHNRRNYSMIFRLMSVSKEWSADRMAKRAKQSGKIFYALADAVLNDRELGKALSKEDFQALINLAPLDGPCCGTEDCTAPDGWKSSQLWFHTNHRDGNPYGQTYEYPGMDFMLLYNLFHYYYQADLPGYRNKQKIVAPAEIKQQEAKPKEVVKSGEEEKGE